MTAVKLFTIPGNAAVNLLIECVVSGKLSIFVGFRLWFTWNDDQRADLSRWTDS